MGIATIHKDWHRGFWCLMATQFQTAFSDNALKQIVILLVLQRVSEAERDGQVALVGFLFAMPFILFSLLGGWLADFYSKKRVLSAVKVAEVGIMLYAALALSLHNISLELVAVFLMGCHSAIFAPSKYGILPEILPHEKLSWGNGILELLTFLGIIFGIAAAGLFMKQFGDQQGIAGGVLACLALCGWVISWGITPVPSANPGCLPQINPILDIWPRLAKMRADRDLWRANWGNAGFFFIAALVQLNLAIYAKDVLHLPEDENAYLTLSLALGIGIGSVFAGYVSRGRIEYRLVPLGAVGIALSGLGLGWPGIHMTWVIIWLAVLGFAGGLFIVPITAVLQHRPAPEDKGAVQGAANVVSFVGIIGSSGVLWVSRTVFGLTTGQVFWFCGAAALVVGAYAAISRRRFVEVE